MEALVISAIVFVVLLLLGIAFFIRASIVLGPKYACTNRRCIMTWELHELVNSCCPNCGTKIRWK